ncbi:MAG: (Fe-S)-binding protein [Alphaproteobacteria bacterium]|nr:(Fe-S)-binding protein [Alphaproteobacteria bacterium]
MVNVMEIYQLLPKTNCKKCGYPSCMAFAMALLGKKNVLEDCPPLVEEPKYAKKLENLEELLKPLLGADATETGMIIHTEKCYGCGNCVVACPVNVANDPKGTAIGKGPVSGRAILIVKDGVIKCVNLDECRRFGPEKVLCNACLATCPSKAIEFV